jgi:hypothetical protein
LVGVVEVERTKSLKVAQVDQASIGELTSVQIEVFEVL